MALPLKQATTTLVRAATRTPTLRSSATAVSAQQQRSLADASTSHAVFNSPFHRGSGDQQDTTAIPSFKKYRSGNEQGNRVFSYFMVGAFGGLTAMGAKDTVQSASSI